MTEIAAFLTARLDEDEAAAGLATPGPWHVDPMRSNVVRSPEVLDRVGTAGTRTDLPVLTGQTASRPRSWWEADAAHIARHDPARVLAEVAAKRYLLEWCLDVVDHFDWSNLNQPGSLLHDPNARATNTATMAMCAMAAPYAEHPDYDESWR